MPKEIRTTKVVIKTQFPAIHSWPECSYKDVEYLKHPHRHVFHVTMKWNVSESREIEFIRMKQFVDSYIRYYMWDKDLGNISCEAIAEKLANQFDAEFTSVYEDEENGAEYERRWEQ